MRIVALVLVAGCWLAPAADLSAVRHVPHFDQVNDYIYRGGQPTIVGLEELGAFGIKRVIDLREKGPATELEQRDLDKLKIKYTNIPFAGFAAPSRQQVESVLALLSDAKSGPIFLHCWRGKDRTGTVIACYRIQHDGWTNARALDEAKDHGMSSFERGMRSFVLHFTASANGTSPFPLAPTVQ